MHLSYKRLITVVIGLTIIVAIGAYLLSPLYNPNSFTQAATAGPRTATSSSDCTSSGGGLAWVDPGNAAIVDTSYARVTLDDADTWSTSQTLRCRNFGFTTAMIPEDAEIEGVSMMVRRQAGGGSVMTLTTSLLKPAGQKSSISGSDTWSKSEETVTYGGESDLWNTTLSVSDVTHSDFGVELAEAPLSMPSSRLTASVLLIEVAVHFASTNPTPTPTPAPSPTPIPTPQNYQLMRGGKWFHNGKLQPYSFVNGSNVSP